MRADVDDVVAAILEEVSPVGTMKLHKLLFFVQGWWMAHNPEPMFDAPFVAADTGPVCPPVTAGYGNTGWVGEWPAGDVNRLTAGQREHIRAVVDAYGGFTGGRLADEAKRLRCWRVAVGHGTADPISDAAMAAEFAELCSLR